MSVTISPRATFGKACIRQAITKVGERIPLAFRFAKMLRDLVNTRCGPSSGQPIVPLTFPRPSPEVGPFCLQNPSISGAPSDQPFNDVLALHDVGTFVSLA